MRPFRSWRCAVALAAVVLCAGAAFAAPNVRVKRGEELDAVVPAADADSAVNPLTSQDAVAIGDDLDRDKRKVPDPKYETKNAILGFVFGKINSFIDAKTRFIDKLDHANIEKNKQHHIEPPKPVPDFQSLISSVITPKVQFITSKIGSLSGSFLGGSSGGGGGHSGDDDHHGNGGGAPQLGNIVSSLLKLSGPILSGSSGSQHGGSNTVSLGDHDDDE
uniref:Secreted protein n=1 Tax=Anopheles dirus TaxID=7168 RepID=A0A1Y9H253_9DIPT